MFGGTNVRSLSETFHKLLRIILISHNVANLNFFKKPGGFAKFRDNLDT